MQLEVAKNVLHNIRAKNIRASSCSLADQEDKRNWGEEIEAIDLVLEKLEQIQKENEELRQNYDIATTKIEELRKKLSLKCFDVNVVYNDYLEKLREFKSNSIPKDKIREIATKLDKETGWLFEEEGSWSYCEPFRDIAKELKELSKEE